MFSIVVLCVSPGVMITLASLYNAEITSPLSLGIIYQTTQPVTRRFISIKRNIGRLNTFLISSLHSFHSSLKIGLALADGLSGYSERGKTYVEEIKK